MNADRIDIVLQAATKGTSVDHAEQAGSIRITLGSATDATSVSVFLSVAQARQLGSQLYLTCGEIDRAAHRLEAAVREEIRHGGRRR